MSLTQRDCKLIWHPFTQSKIADAPIPIVRGEGVRLYDEAGKEYLDLISSWWVNMHGHAHPAIARAIYEQAKVLEHVMFAGFTHEPAIKLCEQLHAILSPQLNRFFFADNGATAVEAALKMAYQYCKNKGEDGRSLFLSFEGGYHGDTVGAMSAGRTSGFYEPFSELMFEIMAIPFPDTWDNDEMREEKEQTSLKALNKLLLEHGHKIAAFIAEPLVQGASGMRMCRPEYMREAMELVQSHGILVILDEVMTGLGRTGSNFAYQQIGVVPDFICLSKGISGGFLPLALTVATDNVYQAFLGDDFSTAFAHGHSYSANPLGCAAAIASLELLCASKTQQAIAQINQTHVECLTALTAENSSIRRPRVRGTIAAFDFKGPAVGYDYQWAIRLKRAFLEQGLLIRPLGNTIYLLPPYCITSEELRHAYQEIDKVLRAM